MEFTSARKCLDVRGDVHLSYLPMAHIFEKVMANGALYLGYAIGFYQGDV